MTPEQQTEEATYVQRRMTEHDWETDMWDFTYIGGRYAGRGSVDVADRQRLIQQILNLSRQHRTEAASDQHFGYYSRERLPGPGDGLGPGTSGWVTHPTVTYAPYPTGTDRDTR